MRTLTSLFLMTALSFSIGCSGGDDDDGGGPSADASTNGPDAMPTGPDAMPSGGTGAANLGAVCNDSDKPCSSGVCTVLVQGADGLCSLACTMAGMTDVCGEADGFPGPGVGYCGLGEAPNQRCAIGCGQQNGGDTSCPTGLTCQDLIDGDGTGDLCAPPPPA